MADSERSEITPISFVGQHHPDLPVEVLDRSAMVERLGVDHFARPQRASFYLVLLIRAGAGTHRVDFETVPVRPAGRNRK